MTGSETSRTHGRVLAATVLAAPDGAYDAVFPGTTTQSFDSDIVLADGQFLQQPGGEQR